jgi:hypothetical protein
LDREQHIGLGCALENLVRGAVAHGLRPSVTLMPDGNDPTRVARVELAPLAESASSDPRYHAIGRRHTKRLFISAGR